MKTNTFTSLLQTLFIGLKLTNHLEWSWFWVLSPIWISLSLVVITFLIVFIYYGWFETPEAKAIRILNGYLKK